MEKRFVGKVYGGKLQRVSLRYGVVCEAENPPSMLWKITFFNCPKQAKLPRLRKKKLFFPNNDYYFCRRKSWKYKVTGRSIICFFDWNSSFLLFLEKQMEGFLTCFARSSSFLATCSSHSNPWSHVCCRWLWRIGHSWPVSPKKLESIVVLYMQWFKVCFDQL